ncbi:MAG: helix-hairpin-helix domain-containing protein [Lewinellaceae bacterium]|nr:helix-hairpin-helix domain-containing protein [Lewinellaceae bacterium]
MLKPLIRQFHFSRAERHGAAALLLLASLSFAAPELLPLLHRPVSTDFSGFENQIKTYRAAHVTGEALPTTDAQAALFFFDPNTAPVETLVKLGVPEKVARTIAKFRERGGRFRSPDDLGKIYTLPEEIFERLRPFVRIGGDGRETARRSETAAARPEQFHFDPNTAREADLLRLGLPKALVGRLLRYREKGGFFFEKTDFRKLYGLSDADYARLEPYITIAKSDVAVRPAAYAGGAGYASAPITDLDINAATVDAWKRLPGIGAGRANQLVRFREKLDGFVSVEQVAETFGLPDSVFQGIRPYLRVESAVFRKINLNVASEDELAAHPYFSFKQAKLIAAYREQHGRFGSADDLTRIAAFTDKTWMGKVRPYLAVE